MKHGEKTTEEIITTASDALSELHDLTREYELNEGEAYSENGKGLPVSNLILCIYHVLSEALNTIEKEQARNKSSGKNKIRAVTG